MKRSTDKEEKTMFRSSRFFNQNGKLYFDTREGVHGPFLSVYDAEIELSLHLRMIEDFGLNNYSSNYELKSH